MALNRVLTVKVGFERNGVLISDLNTDFQIDRSIKFSANMARLKIYNPSSDTQENFLKKGASLIVSAGYEDEGTGVIYIGQITKSSVSREGPNKIVVIEAGSIQNANRDLKHVDVSLSYKRGTAVTAPLNDIAKALGLATYGFKLASSIKMANGFCMVSSAKKALDRCKGILGANGIDLFIDNTTVVLYKIGSKDTRFEVAKLSPETGLISAAKVTDSTKTGDSKKKFPIRVSFTALLNPSLNPNGVIDIESAEISGVFILEKVSFSGNNYGGEFKVSGEGVAS